MSARTTLYIYVNIATLGRAKSGIIIRGEIQERGEQIVGMDGSRLDERRG